MTWGDLWSVNGNREAYSGMRRAVVGIGNALLSDEGIGCHVVRALEEMPLRDVETIDGGTCPDVLELLGDVGKLIIVDAVKAGGPPGQIYRFHPEDIALEQRAFLSLHDMSLLDGLKLVRLRHSIGEAVIFGIEPGELGWGLELSPELETKLPQIIDVILEELNNTSPKGEVRC